MAFTTAKRKDTATTPPEEPAKDTKVDQIHKMRTLPVPDSILKELPCARWWFEFLFAVQESYLPMLEAELAAASRRDHAAFARAFVAFYKVREEAKNVFSKDEGALNKLWTRYNGKLLPEALDGAGVTNVPLAEGIRVTASETYRASIKAEMRDKAYAWLRQNGYGDLVTTTVNASSLSSLATELTEENQEFPEELFNLYIQRGMSVTKTGVKKDRKE